jgi:hypothetical protein
VLDRDEGERPWKIRDELAVLGRLEGEEPLLFRTSNGPVSLTLPAGTNAWLDARTSNGRIQSDFPVTVSGAGRGTQLTGTIGTGGRSLGGTSFSSEKLPMHRP